MRKIEIEKNRLDLAYKKNLQLLNAILVIGMGSFVAYLAAFLLNRNRIFEYSVLLFVVGGFTLILYKRIDRDLREISSRIMRLYIK